MATTRGERAAPRRGLVGRVLGDRYRIVKLVSAGANTLIATADDVVVDRAVTVKLVRPEWAESPAFRRAFDDEMRRVSSLSHPNLAAVYDWGEEVVGKRTTVYTVVEHLGGGSLRDLLDRGRSLDPSQALMVGLEACRGLDFAHRQRLVHSELTPSKLVFGDDRRLRIVDFGLARLLGARGWAEPATLPTHVARYASPEQALQQPITGKSDVYSLTLILVEAVSRNVPFAARSTVATLSARVGRLMPASADLGPLASVLERAGRPESADRATAAELGRALVAVAAKLPRPTPIPIVVTRSDDDPERIRRPNDPTGGVARPRPESMPVLVTPLPPPAAPPTAGAERSGMAIVAPPAGTTAVAPAPEAVDDVAVDDVELDEVDDVDAVDEDGDARTATVADADANVAEVGETNDAEADGADAPVDDAHNAETEDTDARAAGVADADVAKVEDVDAGTAEAAEVDVTEVAVSDADVDQAAEGAAAGAGRQEEPAADPGSDRPGERQPASVPGLTGLVDVEATTPRPFLDHDVSTPGIYDGDVDVTQDELAALAVAPADEPPAAATPGAADWGPRTGALDAERPRRRWVVALLGFLALATLTALAALAYLLFRAPTHEVPELAGETVDVARTQVQGFDWDIEIIDDRSDEQPVPGAIIRTEPEAGDDLGEGEPFLIVVSEGPEFRRLPELAQLTQADAETELAELRLTAQTPTEAFDETVPPGRVVSWSVPADPTLVAGGEVLPEAEVALVVSKGPAPRTVPTLVELTVADAVAALEALQLEAVEAPGVFSDTVPSGGVISATPEAGSEVERGTEVEIVPSKGQDLVVLPRLTGLTLAQAREALAAADLRVGTVIGNSQGRFAQATVAGDVVGAGDSFKRGSTIDLALI